MAKKVTGYIKLQVKAGQANPSPPIGPALGQKGVNIMAFCKEFNAKTAEFKDVPLRVLIKVYEDKSYDWMLKGPPSSWYIKQAAGLARGADRSGHETVGAISLKHLYEIAKVKQADMPGMSLRGVVKCLMSQCQSMGVKVVERPEDA